MHPPAGGAGDGAAFSLARYLDEIGIFPPLEPGLEAELAQRVQDGARASARIDAHRIAAAGGGPARDVLEVDALIRSLEVQQRGNEAKDRLIEANLRLVVPIAERHCDQGIALVDLIVEGNFGLMRAVDGFDTEKGFRFSTYARWWIRQAITAALAEQARAMGIRIKGDEPEEPEEPEDPEGGSRVREPRRPLPPSGSGVLELTSE
ncbi:MAG: sigma-70 family RNA polymerase sigma factor [Acidimicrobiales bacterium]